VIITSERQSESTFFTAPRKENWQCCGSDHSQGHHQPGGGDERHGPGKLQKLNCTGTQFTKETGMTILI